MPRLILASGSPRRHQLLDSIGVEHLVQVTDVDESVGVGEGPSAYVARVAKAKAMAVVARLGMGATGNVAVLAADTTVERDGEIFGKPVDDAEARAILRRLSGATHRVHTGVYGWRLTGVSVVNVVTEVTFVHLSDADIEWYLGFGEHLDKAGGYGMQDAGAALVERIDGSPTNVIGLPLVETMGVLRDLGVVSRGMR